MKKIVRGTCFLLLVFQITYFVVLDTVYAGKKEEPGGDSLYIPSMLEELEGTWVNESMSHGQEYQKMVYTLWGYFEVFRHIKDTKPSGRGTSTIVDKCTDDDGNIWYLEYCRVDWGRTLYYRLIKISNNSNQWEPVQSTIGFPSPADFSEDVRGKMSYRLFRMHIMEACCH